MFESVRKPTWMLPLAGCLLTASLISGCGVRGSLDPPPQAQNSGTATSAEAGDAGEGSAAKPKRHRGFILDGLL